MKRETEPTNKSAGHSIHDAAFKEQAVLLMAEGTRTITALAGELGVSSKTLRNWRLRYGAAQAGARSAQTSLRVCAQGDGARGPIALAAEVARLQADLRHVTIQRDILKKPWPLSARHPSSPRDDLRHALPSRQHPSPHRHVPDPRSIAQRLL